MPADVRLLLAMVLKELGPAEADGRLNVVLSTKTVRKLVDAIDAERSTLVRDDE